MRFCRTCRTEKPESEFFRKANLYDKCKECVRAGALMPEQFKLNTKRRWKTKYLHYCGIEYRNTK